MPHTILRLPTVKARTGVVARIVAGPHDAHRQDPHLPMRYDTGRPSSVIRLRIAQPRTTSLPCGVARRPASHVRYDSGDTPSMAANEDCDWPSAIRHSRSVRGSTTFTPCHRRRSP